MLLESSKSKVLINKKIEFMMLFVLFNKGLLINQIFIFIYIYIYILKVKSALILFVTK
jgi:hypothetical protein